MIFIEICYKKGRVIFDFMENILLVNTVCKYFFKKNVIHIIYTLNNKMFFDVFFKFLLTKVLRKITSYLCIGDI